MLDVVQDMKVDMRVVMKEVMGADKAASMAVNLGQEIVQSFQVELPTALELQDLTVQMQLL